MHFPVLLEEVIFNLKPEVGDIILDATAGGGGHARAILEKIAPGGKLITLDRDQEAVRRVREELKDFQENLVALNENFKNVDKVLDSCNIDRIDGALFDLGMSSFQLDEPERGFSFSKDGSLDMRFNTSEGMTACDVVNKFSMADLAQIIKKYGEERHSKLVAKAIVEYRRSGRIQTTGELAEIINKAIGRKYSRLKLHPAARTFQALRIYVNDELGALEEGVKKALSFLSPTARICVISFHSLEDRIVKNIFRTMARVGDLELVVKKPVRPSEGEIDENPRSRSAKLRVAEKL